MSVLTDNFIKQCKGVIYFSQFAFKIDEVSKAPVSESFMIKATFEHPYRNSKDELIAILTDNAHDHEKFSRIIGLINNPMSTKTLYANIGRSPFPCQVQVVFTGEVATSLQITLKDKEFYSLCSMLKLHLGKEIKVYVDHGEI